MDKEGIDLQTFKTVFERGNLFASGCAVEYASSLIVAKPTEHDNSDDVIYAKSTNDARISLRVTSKQQLAPGIRLGMRIPSHKVLNQADARPWHIQELLPSSGAWRLLVFAGDLLNKTQLERFERLGRQLGSPQSFLKRYGMGKVGDHTIPLIEVLTIHSAPRAAIELSSIPDIFRPFSSEHGWDYHKIFVDDLSYHEGHGQAYDNYGIDKHGGCLVLVRPDQYVGWIGALEDVGEANRLFSSFTKV
jgi:phenol 2-monooxygenase